MKYSRRWKWENTWQVFALVALVILPWLLAVGFVSRLGDVYQQVPNRALLGPIVFGFVWGIAQCTFGLGIEAVGMALAFAVVSGLACLSGSLVPLLVLDASEFVRPRGMVTSCVRRLLRDFNARRRAQFPPRDLAMFL